MTAQARHDAALRAGLRRWDGVSIDAQSAHARAAAQARWRKPRQNLLDQWGFTVVSRGTAVIERVSARRWRLTTPDGYVSTHTSERKAKTAADDWLEGTIDAHGKEIACMGLDIRIAGA
jgi:hypothetical protein